MESVAFKGNNTDRPATTSARNFLFYVHFFFNVSPISIKTRLQSRAEAGKKVPSHHRNHRQFWSFRIGRTLSKGDAFGASIEYGGRPDFEIGAQNCFSGVISPPFPTGKGRPRLFSGFDPVNPAPRFRVGGPQSAGLREMGGCASKEKTKGGSSLPSKKFVTTPLIICYFENQPYLGLH